LDEHSSRNNDRQEDLDLSLREKDEEIEVYKSGMEQALMELEELRLVSGDLDNIRYLHTNCAPL
jgi:hypothetical protein